MVNFEPPEEKRGESKKLSVEAKKVVKKTANLLQSAKKDNSDKSKKSTKKSKLKNSPEKNQSKKSTKKVKPEKIFDLPKSTKTDKLSEAIKKVRIAEISKITKSLKNIKSDKLTEAIKKFSTKQKNIDFEKKDDFDEEIEKIKKDKKIEKDENNEEDINDEEDIEENEKNAETKNESGVTDQKIDAIDEKNKLNEKNNKKEIDDKNNDDKNNDKNDNKNSESGDKNKNNDKNDDNKNAEKDDDDDDEINNDSDDDDKINNDNDDDDDDKNDDSEIENKTKKGKLAKKAEKNRKNNKSKKFKKSHEKNYASLRERVVAIRSHATTKYDDFDVGEIEVEKARSSQKDEFRISKLTNASTRALMMRLIARKVDFDIDDDNDDFRINKPHTAKSRGKNNHRKSENSVRQNTENDESTKEIITKIDADDTDTKSTRRKSKSSRKTTDSLSKKQREKLRRTKSFVIGYGQFMTWFGLVTTVMSLILIIRAAATVASLSMAGNSPETLQGMDVFGIATYGLIILPYAVFNFLFSVDYMLYGNKIRQLLLPKSRMRHVTSSTMILLILQILLSGVLIWLGLYDYVPVFMWLSIFQAGFVFYTLYYKIRYQRNYERILK